MFFQGSELALLLSLAREPSLFALHRSPTSGSDPPSTEPRLLLARAPDRGRGTSFYETHRVVGTLDENEVSANSSCRVDGFSSCRESTKKKARPRNKHFSQPRSDATSELYNRSEVAQLRVGFLVGFIMFQSSFPRSRGTRRKNTYFHSFSVNQWPQISSACVC